jgi:MFS family permease
MAIDGTYQIEIIVRDVTYPLTVTFKTEGNSLHVVSTDDKGRQRARTGTVNGNDFTFSFRPRLGIKMTIRGTVDGNYLTGKQTFLLGNGPVIGTRDSVRHPLDAHPDAYSGQNVPDKDGKYVPPWMMYFPYLGKAPALTARQWKVLALIVIVTVFEQYDLYLFSLALKQIQEALSIPENRLGELGAFISMGAFPAVLLSIAADRFGRRQILLLTIVGYTILTGATAFSTDAKTFVMLQFLARAFAVAEVTLAYVVIAEEIEPEHRGWATGALSALSQLGGGLALLLFAFVDILPMGWRTLYLVGLGPLSIVAWLRRSMPETKRFEDFRDQKAAQSFVRDSITPILNLVRMYPGRFAAIGSVGLLLAFSQSASGFFTPKYLQEAHSWAPWHFSMLSIFGGVIAIVGNAYAGRLSDRKGRRRISAIFLLMQPLFVIGFYKGFGWLLPPLWVGMAFFGNGGRVILTAFGNELFPTSYRSTASGAMVVLGTIGSVAGLWSESRLYELTGSHWTAIPYLVMFTFLAPVIVAKCLPETSGLSLEETAPEVSQADRQERLS